MIFGLLLWNHKVKFYFVTFKKKKLYNKFTNLEYMEVFGHIPWECQGSTIYVIILIYVFYRLCAITINIY